MNTTRVNKVLTYSNFISFLNKLFRFLSILSDVHETYDCIYELAVLMLLCLLYDDPVKLLLSILLVASHEAA